MPLREFPKSIALRDGSRVTLRPLIPTDEPALLAFCRPRIGSSSETT
jgi:hypothetical protein